MRTRRANAITLPAVMLGLWALVSLPWAVRAGGPLLVGGPMFGIEGQPFIWDPAAMPVLYRVDGGPLSRKLDGTIVIDNAAGVARVQAMFQVWQDVPTAAISFSNAGTLAAAGGFSDGDVDTVWEFNEVIGSCAQGLQSPIIFDADGSIFQQLTGESAIIGFAAICKLDETRGLFLAGMAMLNGRFQDGIDTPSSYPANYEMTAADFDEAFAHEFGHFAGLDHSQINVRVLLSQPGQCPVTELAGLPLMFPFAVCQARSTGALPMLAPDDLAWISKLYPETVNSPPNQVPYETRYGTIRGTIFFSDGETHAQGVNVIARDTVNPRKIAVSVVSGYLFTGNPGQNVTGTNSGGSALGSRDPLTMGTYEIPLPPGNYYVEVESVSEWFVGGSGVGPLNPPIPNPGRNEYWNVNESATDSVTVKDAIPVPAGGVVSEKNIILNGTPLRFDSFESARLWWPEPIPASVREEKLSLAAVAG